MVVPWCCLCIFLSSQCDPPIEFLDNERLLFKGRVVDVQGNPRVNVSVEIFASRDFFDPEFSNSSEDALLGTALTDANGNFSFVSLSPRNALNFYALVNFISVDVFTGQTPLVINGIDALERNDFTYDLGNLTVENIVNYDFDIERTTNTTDTLQYSLRFKPQINTIDFDVNNNMLPELLPFPSLVGELLPTENVVQENFRVRETDTIVLEYQLVNGSVQEMETLTIIVNESPENFLFRF